MPARSKAPQKAAGRPCCKTGEAPQSKLQGASREMYESMSEKELDEMASVKRSQLPEFKHSK